MAVFTVDSDAVLTQSTAIRGTIERLQGETQAMMAQLTQLQAAWSGQAATAFNGSVDTWRGTQRQVEDSLGMITQSLATAGRQYADAEVANVSLFR